MPNSNKGVIPAYQYEPIETEGHRIRVLQLRPGRKPDDIHCRFQICSLNAGTDALSYWALSYAWGDHDQTEKIFLEGCPKSITRNLYIALQHLRNKRKKVQLWVDALCIDQSNIQERNHQVAQMKQIYGAAEKVIVWLGEGDAASDFGMDFLRWAPLSSLGDAASEFAIDFLLLSPSSSTWGNKAVFDLLQRPWWTRIWVLQEVAAAQHEPIVWCGDRQIPWSCFYCLASKAPINNWSCSLLTMPRKAGQRTKNGFLLDSTAHYQMFLALVDDLWNGGSLRWRHVFSLGLTMKASEPRDLIYATLGLVAPGETCPMVPDYSQSEMRIRCEATAHSIEVECSFESLTLTSPGLDSHLPSWVPDFDKGVLGLFHEPGVDHYKAAGPTTPRVEWSDDYQIMRTDGIVIDTVEKVTAEEEKGSVAKSKRLAYETGRGNGLEPAETKEAFWRSLIANQGRSCYGTTAIQYPASSDYGLRYMAWQREIEVPREFIGEGEEEEWRLEYLKPIFASHSAFSEHGQSRFITTRSGRFGLGQCGVRPEDLLCVLFGGRVVFILRDHGHHHTLVGCAYIHGVMDGELAHRLSDPSAVRQFGIR